MYFYEQTWSCRFYPEVENVSIILIYNVYDIPGRGDDNFKNMEAPDVKIKIDVEHSSSIEKREIDGVTYLSVLLSATSDIEIDGIR